LSWVAAAAEELSYLAKAPWRILPWNVPLEALLYSLLYYSILKSAKNVDPGHEERHNQELVFVERMLACFII
jgi:hypothetical protein